jgi:hypothetical protein
MAGVGSLTGWQSMVLGAPGSIAGKGVAEVFAGIPVGSIRWI